MAYCSQCGTEVPNHIRTNFCRNCGMALSSHSLSWKGNEKPEQSRPSSGSGRPFVTPHRLLIALMIVVVAVGLLTIAGLKRESKTAEMLKPQNKTTDKPPSVAATSEIASDLDFVKALIRTDGELKKTPYDEKTFYVMVETLRRIPKNAPEYQEGQTLLAALKKQAKLVAPAKPDSKRLKQDSYFGARLAFVELLQAIYDKEGRLIKVRAEGVHSDILSLESDLISNRSYTYQAARRETLDCAYCMAAIQQARFKQVVIKGSSEIVDAWSVR